MKKIWFSFGIVLLFLFFLEPINNNNETFPILFVMFHSILVVFFIMSYRSIELKALLLLAFLLRVSLLFGNIYADHIFILPHSHSDDIGYYEAAKAISNNLTLLWGNIYGDLYSKVLGIIFYLTGSSKVIGGYINVLLGMSVGIILLKIMTLLNIREKLQVFIAFFAYFFPSSLIMSVIFRREMIITFFVAFSIYYFVNWYLEGNLKFAIYSILLLLLGSMFHSGVIGILFGYIFAYLFYSKTRNSFKFTSKSIVYFIVILSFGSLMYYQYGEQIFAKFGELNGVNDIVAAFSTGSGGAEYLSNLTINNPLELVVYTPIKMIYFLISPLPWDWRGFPDIFTFVFDSFLYLITVIYFIKNRKNFDSKKCLIQCLLLSIIGATLIFGIGVGNAGTAMRHRQKLIPLFLSMGAVMLNNKKELKNFPSESLDKMN